MKKQLTFLAVLLLGSLVLDAQPQLRPDNIDQVLHMRFDYSADEQIYETQYQRNGT